MKNNITLLISSLFLFTAINAQSPVNDLTGVSFLIGYEYVDASALQAFTGAGAPELQQNNISFGGQFIEITNNWVVTGGGYGFHSPTTSTDSLDYNLNAGFGELGLGYLIVNSGTLKMYPAISLGGGTYEMQITNNQNISAANIASDPGQEINISRGYFTGDVALNIDLTPSMTLDEDTYEYSGFLVGFQIGYTQGLAVSSWKYTGGNITDGPDFNPGMIYARFKLGFMSND